MHRENDPPLPGCWFFQRSIMVAGQHKASCGSSSGPARMLDLRDNGSGLLRGIGLGGQSCTIESTTDPWTRKWIRLGSATTQRNGRFLLIDENAQFAELPMKFYRAVALAHEGTEASEEKSLGLCVRVWRARLRGGWATRRPFLRKRQPSHFCLRIRAVVYILAA